MEYYNDCLGFWTDLGILLEAARPELEVYFGYNSPRKFFFANTFRYIFLAIGIVNSNLKKGVNNTACQKTIPELVGFYNKAIIEVRLLLKEALGDYLTPSLQTARLQQIFVCNIVPKEFCLIFKFPKLSLSFGYENDTL